MKINKPNLDAFKGNIHDTTDTNLQAIRTSTVDSRQCAAMTASVSDIEKQLFDAIDAVDSLIDGYNNTVQQWFP